MQPEPAIQLAQFRGHEEHTFGPDKKNDVLQSIHPVVVTHWPILQLSAHAMQVVGS